MKRFLALGVCLIALAAPQPGQASPVLVSSTASFAALSVTSPASFLAPGVTLNFPVLGGFTAGLITSSPNTGAFTGMPSLLPVLLNAAANPVPGLASITVALGEAFNFTIPTWGRFVGSITEVDFTGSSARRVLDFVSANGTFTPVCDGLTAAACAPLNPALAGFSAGAAEVTFSANQTGARPNAAISASFTFQWTAPFENGGGGPGVIPVPAGLALFGVALLGLGLAVRRRA